jgi:hypothetical protein
MKREKPAADADLTDSLDGLDAWCPPRADDELGAQGLELPAGADRTGALGQLGFKRLVDTRELVLTAHEKEIVSQWLARP